eukprot:3165186-Amphidinium_carterae.1
MTAVGCSHKMRPYFHSVTPGPVSDACGRAKNESLEHLLGLSGGSVGFGGLPSKTASAFPSISMLRSMLAALGLGVTSHSHNRAQRPTRALQQKEQKVAQRHSQTSSVS